MFNKLKKYLLVTKDDKILKDLTARISAGQTGGGAKNILFDCTHIYYPKWNVKHAFIVASKHNAGHAVEAFNPSMMYFWYGWKFMVFNLVRKISRKDRNLISALGIQKKADFGPLSLGELRDAIGAASQTYKMIESKKDLINLDVMGVKVGDLVYDTYLKWFRKPTVQVKSLRMRFLLVFAYVYAKKVNKLLCGNDYSEVYLTHAVYMGYGFMARFALNLGVDVYVVQNTRGTFIEQLSEDHPFQTPRFVKFKEISEGLDAAERKKGRELAKLRLERRLSGIVDETIYYMKKSGYSDKQTGWLASQVLPYPGRPKTVLFLHCFFDSPHIYRSMLFVDFFEWLDCVLSLCERNKINVFVKEHPNALPGNEKIVAFFKDKYRSAVFVDAQVSNSNFFIGDISLALTVYGTMAHEFAYQGIPVLNAGDNPHVAYGFSLTPKSVNDYESMLLALALGETVFTPDKNEVLDYFYISYLRKRWNACPFFDEKIGSKGTVKDSYSTFLCGLADEDISVIYDEVDTLLKSCTHVG